MCSVAQSASMPQMAKRKSIVGVCAVLIVHLSFPACGPRPGQSGGAGGVAGTAGTAGAGGASDAGNDADASPAACGCDDVRADPRAANSGIPASIVYQPLECYCGRDGGTCPSSMRDYEEQLTSYGCPLGVPVLRTKACGQATVWINFSEPGPVPTFDAESGAPIGMYWESDTPMRNGCKIDGSVYLSYKFGDTSSFHFYPLGGPAVVLDTSCSSAETCALCNADSSSNWSGAPPCAE